MTQRPAWWPTKAQKERADNACRERLEKIQRDTNVSRKAPVELPKTKKGQDSV